jgi:hypothetical protein
LRPVTVATTRSNATIRRCCSAGESLASIESEMAVRSLAHLFARTEFDFVTLAMALSSNAILGRNHVSLNGLKALADPPFGDLRQEPYNSSSQR